MKSSIEESAGEQFLRFIREKAPSARAAVSVPGSIEAWDIRLDAVKIGLRASFGHVPEQPCPLEPEVLGTLRRDGYSIDRLIFQSRPGVVVTANLYRPEPSQGRHPALLSVHGHWAWARIDPHVQPRCIALAKLGYVVLCVDAFGAGERAVTPAAGTYHGALLGASLWPLGTPLIGLQVYDNRRAIDYLLTRGDVDPKKLAITGASGGGNQTLYAGATDERLAAVVPVCGVGTYEAYLQSACCVCEVNPGGLTYATTGDLLAMVAPRALMVISATRDAFQFSVGEAKKSIDYARNRYRLLGQPEKIRHVAIESGHDYNQAMREALYGWLEKWLRGKGDGSPISEPELKLEDPTDLRCFPDASKRPKAVVTIPRFAQQTGLERLANLPKVPDHKERWQAESQNLSTRLREVLFGRYPASLRDTVLGGSSPGARIELDAKQDGRIDRLTARTEPGIQVSGSVVENGTRGTALLLGGPPPFGFPIDSVTVTRKQIDDCARESGLGTVEIGLRAWGTNKPATQPIVGVVDHNEAEWSLWVGRPLLGQWVIDTIRWMTALDEWRLSRKRLPTGRLLPPRPYVLAAQGPLGLVALLTAALDPRVESVLVSDCLVSFVAETEKPWSGIPMGVLVPNLLDVADVAQIAGLISPRRLLITNGVNPEGDASSSERLRSAFAWTGQVYKLFGAERNLVLDVESGKLPRI